LRGICRSSMTPPIVTLPPPPPPLVSSSTCITPTFCVPLPLRVRQYLYFCTSKASKQLSTWRPPRRFRSRPIRAEPLLRYPREGVLPYTEPHTSAYVRISQHTSAYVTRGP
jgi:hypothetical protein